MLPMVGLQGLISIFVGDFSIKIAMFIYYFRGRSSNLVLQFFQETNLCFLCDNILISFLLNQIFI